MVILFTPLPKPTANGKWRCANAKPASVSKISHFHEDFELRDFLTKMLDIHKCVDLLNGSSLYRGDEVNDNESFLLSYTIPRRVIEPVLITCEEDFMQMRGDATKKLEAEVKVYIVKNKVRFLYFSTSPFSATII